MEFSDCLAALAGVDVPGVPLHYLRGLSGLNAEEVERFRQTWSELDAERRRRLATALSELAEDDVEMDLVAVFRALIKDADAEVRAAAAGSLWEDMEVETLDLLVAALRNDPAAEVRAAAATALGSAVEMIEFEELGGMPAWQVKYGLLDTYQKDQDPEVRRRALESLAFLSEPPIPDLIQQAYDSGDQRMQVSALYAMGRNASDRWRDIILKELKNRDPEIRYEAARAAGEMEDDELVWPLARLIADEDVEVRLQAVNGLGKIGGELAERTLQGLARGEDPMMREAAAEALETLHGLADPLSFHLDFNPNGREHDEDEDLP